MGQESNLGELLTRVRRERFVGRAAELDAFDDWLVDGGRRAPLLQITGPGGIGKTWLLYAMADRSRALCRDTYNIDLAVTGDTPEAALRALTGVGTLSEAAAVISRGESVVFVDGIDAAPALAEHLVHELIPLLGISTRIVLAGRRDLSQRLGAWSELMVRMPVVGLSAAERVEYLRRRGLDAPGATHDVGGHPLALGLAADLAQRMGTEWVRETPEWGRSLAPIVERLTSGTGDQPLLRALEAISVVRRCDRSLLGALIGEEDAAVWFPRLCELSVVKPAAGGISLHDDVRHLVGDHLRWNDPSSHARLSALAIRHLQSRIDRATRDLDRAELGAEAIYVLRDLLDLNRVPFEQSDESLVVETIGGERLRELIERRGADPAGHLPEEEYAALWEVLGVPGAYATAVLDMGGGLRAYGAVMPVWRGSVNALPESGLLSCALRAAASEIGLSSIPETMGESNLWHYTVGVAPPTETAARAAMFREVMVLLSRGGAYVLVASEELWEEFGRTFDRGGVAWQELDLPRDVTGGRHVLLGDYSRTSLIARLGALMDGRAIASLPGGHELSAVASSVVAGWSDDAVLASSVVAEVLAPAADLSVAERAARVREFVRSALGSDSPTPSLSGRMRRALHDNAFFDVPAHSCPSYQVRMLGTFEVTHEGVSVNIGDGVPAAAVKVTALAGSMTAEALIETLWPEVEPSAGRTRLRTTLARVRKAAPGLLCRDHETISLGVGVDVDARRFSEGADALLGAREGERDRWLLRAREVLDLYGGELLPSDPYAEWAELPREELARRAVRLLDAVAESLSRSGDRTQAIAMLEQALAIEPFSEERYVAVATELHALGWTGRARDIVRRGIAVSSDLGAPAHPDLARLGSALGA